MYSMVPTTSPATVSATRVNSLSAAMLDAPAVPVARAAIGPTRDVERAIPKSMMTA